MKLFWANCGNFGDALNKRLWPKLGLNFTTAKPRDSEAVGIGSLLERVRKDYSGYVLGSGLMYDKARPLPQAKVVAVRGELTRERIGADVATVLGDPGVLANLLLDKVVEEKYDLGVIPHYVDFQHPIVMSATSRCPNTRFIWVGDPVLSVIEQAAQCKVIASSSLHGLILADALGKSSVWVRFSDMIYGGEYKFHDYYSAFDDYRDPVFPQADWDLSDWTREVKPPPRRFAGVAARLERRLREFVLELR